MLLLLPLLVVLHYLYVSISSVAILSVEPTERPPDGSTTLVPSCPVNQTENNEFETLAYICGILLCAIDSCALVLSALLPPVYLPRTADVMRSAVIVRNTVIALVVFKVVVWAVLVTDRTVYKEVTRRLSKVYTLCAICLYASIFAATSIANFPLGIQLSALFVPVECLLSFFVVESSVDNEKTTSSTKAIAAAITVIGILLTSKRYFDSLGVQATMFEHFVTVRSISTVQSCSWAAAHLSVVQVGSMNWPMIVCTLYGHIIWTAQLFMF
jgi:hypothetical protein